MAGAPFGKHFSRIMPQSQDTRFPAFHRPVVIVEDTGIAAALAALLRVDRLRWARKWRVVGHAGTYTLAITRQPFVPPKPKLLLITVSSGRSMRWRTIGRSAKAGSRFSMWALSAAKPLFSISRL